VNHSRNTGPPRWPRLLLIAGHYEGFDERVLDALRAAGSHVPELCLVALDGGEVVGHDEHVAQVRGRLYGPRHEVLTGLGAFALRPSSSGQAVGSTALQSFFDDVLTHQVGDEQESDSSADQQCE
jgi:predicted N-acetyltransferase YhbS